MPAHPKNDPKNPSTKNNIVAVCDLDRTLIKEDLLKQALKKTLDNPKHWIEVIKRIRNPKALKLWLSEATNIDPPPPNQRALEWLAHQKALGRKTALVSGSPQKWAENISKYYNIHFDIIKGTSEETENLTGKNKKKWLDENIQSYAYLGDSKEDIPIWESAQETYFIGTKTQARKLRKFWDGILEEENPEKWKEILKCLRPHQWIKNTLIALPTLAAHQYLQPPTLWATLLAILSFCLISSTGYIINDLLDQKTDQTIKEKSLRPIARGTINKKEAIILTSICLITGIFTSLFIHPKFLLAVLLYLLCSFLYTFYIKRIPILDITFLSCLYTLRILAGGIATQIPVSFWLLATSIFFFLSLSCNKRITELRRYGTRGNRGYTKRDILLLTNIGITSALTATAMLALYTQTGAEKIYALPQLTWSLPILCLVWSMLFWRKSYKENSPTDPVIQALKMKETWIIAILGITTLLLAKHL